MNSKKMILILVSLVILCVCIFLMISRPSHQTMIPPNATLICEETVSPNKEYVSDVKDIVYDTIQVYQTENGTIYVSADSNSAIFENINYTVNFNQVISKEDVQIKWTTLMGSTKTSENDQLGLAFITISKNGTIISEKTISFVSRGINAITDVIG